MISTYIKKNLCKIPYVFLFLLIILFLYKHTSYLYDDSLSYINFDATRPPLYPFFIWLFHWIPKYQFQAVVWTQSILTFCTMLYARNWLSKHLKISEIAIFLVLLLILITICFHFQMGYVGSEGLAFPIFIFTFFPSVECFQKFSFMKISFFAVMTGLLILTRLQFYYLYGIFILLFGWYFWKKVPVKSCFICVAILFGSTLFTFLIDQSYHYFKHHDFSGAPTAGVQLIIQPLLLAKPHAANYFKDPNTK